MALKIISACSRQPAWVDDSCAFYSKRLPPEYRLDWRDLPLVERGKSRSLSVVRREETQKILSAIPDRSFVVALDEGGRNLTTVEFAEKLSRWMQNHAHICFVIGGPDGLDLDCSRDGKKAGGGRWYDFSWSLSALTFPHPLVRVVLVEQLYRAYSIQTGHPYHRE